MRKVILGENNSREAEIELKEVDYGEKIEDGS